MNVCSKLRFDLLWAPSNEKWVLAVAWPTFVGVSREYLCATGTNFRWFEAL